MSSMAVRMSLEDAEERARQIVALLANSCERIEVLGSIRRGSPTVGDIEILCEPTMLTEESSQDLFGESLPSNRYNALDRTVAALMGGGNLCKRRDAHGRPAYGERYKRLWFFYGEAPREAVPLDLFSVLPPAQWGVLSTVRTGPAEFAHRLVTPLEHGGWMPRWMVCRNGALWRLDGAHGVITPTPEEADVFAALGRPYIAPGDREASL